MGQFRNGQRLPRQFAVGCSADRNLLKGAKLDLLKVSWKISGRGDQRKVYQTVLQGGYCLLCTGIEDPQMDTGIFILKTLQYRKENTVQRNLSDTNADGTALQIDCGA